MEELLPSSLKLSFGNTSIAELLLLSSLKSSFVKKFAVALLPARKMLSSEKVNLVDRTLYGAEDLFLHVGKWTFDVYHTGTSPCIFGK